jgi:hypothetical protein
VQDLLTSPRDIASLAQRNIAVEREFA